MNASVKVKQAPGSARPQTQGREDLPAEDHKKFRKVRPYVFVLKLLLMVALIAAFGVGVVATDRAVKQAAACLITLAPLICGVEVLVKSRSTLRNRLKGLAAFLAFGLVAMVFLLAAFAAPTFVCRFGIGAMIAHGLELAHQALHKRGTGKLAYDTPIGLVLCGVSFVSFHYYLWSHLRHHRLNGTEKDRESFDYAYDLIDSPSKVRRLWGLFLHLTLLGHYTTAVKRMALAALGLLRGRLLAAHKDMSPEVASRVEREYQCHLLLFLAAVAVSLAFQTTLLVQLWLIPVLLGWGPAHSLIETTEHWHCDVPNPNVFCNTRSLRAGLFARWYTNHNNCHVGHHRDMSVPMDQLPAFEAMLAESNNFRHMEESYPAFYARFLCHVWTGHSAA